MNEWLDVAPDDVDVGAVRKELMHFNEPRLSDGHPEDALRVAGNIVIRLHPEEIQHTSYLLDILRNSRYNHLAWGESWDCDRLPDDPEDLRERRNSLVQILHALKISYRVAAIEDGTYAERVQPVLGVIAAAEEEHDAIVAALTEVSSCRG